MDFDVALIGFGEAGSSFAKRAGWRDRATAYDRKTDGGRIACQAKLADYSAAGVIDARSIADAAGCAPILLSLVTADQALDAASAAAPFLRAGTLYCDGNSVAPKTKRGAARIVDEAGGRYVDMAILAPVHPAGLSVPILLSGPWARDARTALGALGFDRVSVTEGGVGRASSIKMIRSVMIKGIEALTAECVIAAKRADVLDEVIASLDASEKPRPWAERADYNLDRMLVHGLRRAAEMEEVAKTLLDLGVGPELTRGTVLRQREIGGYGVTSPSEGLAGKLDTIERLSNRGI